MARSKVKVKWDCEVGFYIRDILATSRDDAKKQLSHRTFKGPSGMWITCKKVR